MERGKRKEGRFRYDNDHGREEEEEESKVYQ